MPYFDGTGPLGNGPLTGRGLGFCGFGRRMGFGRGYRHWFRSPTAEEERQDLEAYRKDLEEELARVKAQEEEIMQDK